MLASTSKRVNSVTNNISNVIIVIIITLFFGGSYEGCIVFNMIIKLCVSVNISITYSQLVLC